MTLTELADVADPPARQITLTGQEARDIVEACREHDERADGLRAENRRLRAENARLRRLLQTRPVPAGAYIERRDVAMVAR